MKKILFLFPILILFSSCGVFLQQAGVKNYALKEKITPKSINNYQYDFLYLTKLVEEGFPEIDSVFPKTSRELRIKATVSKLAEAKENTDFVIQARKYLSNFHNQHTNISLNQTFKEVYPCVIYISSDKWYLLNLSKKYDSLYIGKQIVSFNGLPTSEVEKRLINFTFAENKINQQQEIYNLQLYNKPKYLLEIGVIRDFTQKLRLKLADSTEISLAIVSTKDKTPVFDITFKENPLTKYQAETYFYKVYPENKMGYLQFNKCHDKIDIMEGIGSYVKPWLQPLARAYVKNQFKKKKPSKQIAQFYNPRYPVFKDFMWALMDSLNTNKVENLIIDLRHNPGGNPTLGIQLLYFLTDKENLANFREYAFTSEMYKAYFAKEYKALKKIYPKGVPSRELVLTNPNNNLFSDITDPKSVYYIPQNRPIYKGNIYVLANTNTGSAAAMLTTLLQDNEIGTVVGTSVGNNPIGATTYTPMVLPKTKAKISVASTYIVRPKAAKGKFQMPDIWVEYSINDLINGNDVYLDTVQKMIR